MDYSGTPSSAARRILRDMLESSSLWLTAEEATILRLYYGVEGERHTLEDIAEIMHTERHVIRDKRNKALAKMAKSPNKTAQTFAEDLKLLPPPHHQKSITRTRTR